MALQGNGPERKISTLWLQHWHWDGAISSQPSQLSSLGPHTVGDGRHDRLLCLLAGITHCPHHVPTIAVGADDALPTLFPGQALQLLQGHAEGSTPEIWGHTHTHEAMASPAPCHPQYLVSQEEVLDNTCALLPEDHQTPAVPNEEPAAVLRVLLDGFHWSQCLPTTVVIRNAA